MTYARWGITRPQLLIIIFMALILVVVAYFQTQDATESPYDPAATRGDGLRALVLWLEEMQYGVTTTPIARTGLPHDTDVLFLFTHAERPPAYNSNLAAEADATAIYSWVESGGTLVLVGPADAYGDLIARFGVGQVERLTGALTGVRQVQPILPDVTPNWATFFAPYNLEPQATNDLVPILMHVNGAPVVALQFVGDGVVWHMTEDFAFTNYNLEDSRIASFLPAILRTVPAGASVMISVPHLATFDTVFSQYATVATLQDWLYTTPFGQATLVLLIAALIFLILQGRRLGPPLTAPSAARPREAAEYVIALAGLQRRLRQPQTVAAHHRQRLKVAIGRMTQTPADLPDPEWLAQVQRTDILTDTTYNTVSELLAGYAAMSDKRADEGDLIDLVQATDALLASLPRANQQLVR